MSDPASIDDRIEAAVAKAEGGAQIYHDVANGGVGDYVSTESGPLPSLAEWQELNAEALGNAGALMLFDQDLMNAVDPLKGSAKLGRSVVVVESMAALLAAKQDSSQLVVSTAFHPGWAASAVYGPQGGGSWLWDATRPKSQHNGILCASPTVPWDGTQGTLAAFLAGSGETQPGGSGCWVRKFQCQINLMWAGARGDDSSDDTAAITKWRDVIVGQSKKRKGYAPAGVYRYTAGPNWAVKGVHLIGDGKHNTVFKCTTAQQAFRINAFEYGSSPVFDVVLENFCIEGHAACQDLIYVENASHLTLRNINTREANISSGCALKLLWTVASSFENFTCSINEQTMVNRPFNGIVLGVSPSRGLRSTDNIFTNAIIEGVLGAGIVLTEADLNTFIGGTSEANGTYGVSLGTICRNNTFKGLGFEANGTADIICAGINTFIENCYTGRSILFLSGSRRGKVVGGLHERIEMQAGCTGVVLDNLTINYFNTGSGGIVDNGSGTAFRNIWDEDLGAYIYPKKSRSNIAVGPSPYTYKNTTGGMAYVFWTGGSGVSVQYKRSGDTVPGTISGSQILTAADDEVVITYTTAPTANLLPMGEQYT